MTRWVPKQASSQNPVFRERKSRRHWNCHWHSLQMGSGSGGAPAVEAHATAWEFAGVAHTSGNAVELSLADNLWIAGWPKTSKQPFPEATNVGTRKFLTTLKAVPAGCVFAAGRVARPSYSHRTAGWTVGRTERHA